MKVAIIIADISLRAGTERAVCSLANNLAKEYEVTIISICSKQEQQNSYELAPTVEIYHLNTILTGNIVQKIYSRIRLILKLRKIVSDNKIDIIFSARRVMSFASLFLQKSCKKIACEHFNYNQAHWVSKLLRRVFYPKLDAVVLLTQRDAEKYKFVPENKRFVIPNSLSFNCDTPSNCTNKRIIALGRFTPQKGFDYLLQTAVKLKKEIPDWHIDIFGSGDDETMLKDLARKLQVDDFVTFNPPTKEVIKELCNSGMYVMSSRFEGLPMVLIEAQECGLPIVSFDCPEGPSEVIHEGKDGFLVPLADTDALAERIITLAKNEEMRKEFGRNAKINCKQFSPERVGEMWMDLIHKLTVNKENKL